jgi:hypothetical protein
MNKWLLEGVFIGSTALLTGGFISLTTANTSGAILASGAVGGIGTAITSKRKNQNLRDEVFQRLSIEIENKIKNSLLNENQLNNNKLQEKFDVSLANQTNKHEKISLELKNLKSVFSESHINQKSLLARLNSLEVGFYEIKQLNQRVIADEQYFKNDNIHECIKTSQIDDSSALINEGQCKIDVSSSKAWLNSQGISIDEFRNTEGSELSQRLVELSIFLGNNYTSLKSFHNKLAHSSETGSRFRFSLQSRTQDDIRIHTSFASMLQKLGYLSHYFYSKTEKVMNVTPHRNDEITRFLWGDWFEKYIYDKTKKILISQNVDFDFTINPEVKFPNGDTYELDLFISANGRPIWIECKAGKNYDAYLHQYSNQRKILAVPKQNAFVVSLQLEKNEATMRSELWDVTIVNPEMLTDALMLALNNSSNIKTAPTLKLNIEENQETSSPKDLTPLTIFQRSKIKPVTKYRKIILSELVNIFSVLTYSENFLTLKTHLMKKQSIIDSNISSSSISHVLKTLLYAEGFLDDEKKSIKSINTPIHSLACLDENILEKLCTRNYIRQALETDPNYFCNENNTKQFEDFIGGIVSHDMIQ